MFFKRSCFISNSSSLLKVDKLIDWFREAIDEMIEESEYMEMKSMAGRQKYRLAM